MEINIRVEQNKNDITLSLHKVIENIPEGYLKPEGKIEIVDVSEYDVAQYETAQIVDENLKPENIAENIEVLGITGTFKGGVDTSDATAIADDLLLGKTAYVNEEKITGTIESYSGEIENGIEIPDMPDGTMEITENGKYDVNLIAQVEVNVPTGEEYEGEYTIIPSIEEQSMNTKDKLLKENVIIESIPYYETSNESGKTVYIGDKYE